MGNQNESGVKPNEEKLNDKGTKSQKEVKKLKEIPADHDHSKTDRVYIKVVHHNTGYYVEFQYCSTFSLLIKHIRPYCTMEHICDEEGGCGYEDETHQIDVTPEMEAAFVSCISPMLDLKSYDEACRGMARDYSTYICALVYEKKSVSLKKTVSGPKIQLPENIKKLYDHLNYQFRDIISENQA